jgi:hypothetical protein
MSRLRKNHKKCIFNERKQLKIIGESVHKTGVELKNLGRDNKLAEHQRMSIKKAGGLKNFSGRPGPHFSILDF